MRVWVRCSIRASSAKALESIHRYNYKPTLYEHDSVQRTFALNNEPALVICDYGRLRGRAFRFRILPR